MGQTTTPLNPHFRLQNEASSQDQKPNTSDLDLAAWSVKRLDHFIDEYKHLEEDLDIERELVGTMQFYK